MHVFVDYYLYICKMFVKDVLSLKEGGNDLED